MAKENTAKTTEANETIEMTKETLPSAAELMAEIESLKSQLAEAKSGSSTGRKDQVLQVLREHGHISVQKIAKLVGITDKNVSSQMTALRKAGHAIGTDSRGFKFLENPAASKEEVAPETE